ncbi:MAG: GNAT family N-acetyltransferase [Gemmatimonadaceae bacterium]
MAKDVTIRGATSDDVPTLGRLGALLVRLHNELDSKRFIPATPQTEENYGWFLGTQINKQDVFVYVAEREGKVVGYTYAGMEGIDYMALRGPAGALYDIVVDPAFRGQGIGRQLLTTALSALKERGAPRVVLSTAQGNEAAQHLFESAGFRRTMIEMTRELDQAR